MHRPDNVDNPSRLRGLVEAITAVAGHARESSRLPVFLEWFCYSLRQR